MKNCIILGTGRSGTSMVAGTLSEAGYYLGETIMPPTVSNPKGYFESYEVEFINENLLARVLPQRPRILGFLFHNRPRYSQRWLARLSLETALTSTADIDNQIKSIVNHQPFCFKDPRFSYTLPAWRPFLQNTVFICVFRRPSDTIKNIMRECKREKYLRDLIINDQQALEVWRLMYSHILDIHRHQGEWLFLNFNQMFKSESISRLEEFTGANVNHCFPDPRLERSKSDQRVPKDILAIYERLCKLAKYEDSIFFHNA